MIQYNNKQSVFLRILGVVAILFGIMTLKSGGATLFIDSATREVSGNFIPFVVWSNFLMGFAYIIAGIGIWLNQNWTKVLTIGIVTITLLTFFVFGIYILMDGVFEIKTVKVMTFRSLFWIFVLLMMRTKKSISENISKKDDLRITKETIVSDILKKYGDIEDVMGAFGIKSVGKYSIRKIITKFLTVERAAKIHKVPLDEFLSTLNKAIELKNENLDKQ